MPSSATLGKDDVFVNLIISQEPLSCLSQKHHRYQEYQLNGGSPNGLSSDCTVSPLSRLHVIVNVLFLLSLILGYGSHGLSPFPRGKVPPCRRVQSLIKVLFPDPVTPTMATYVCKELWSH
jgi:hypothetical protein